MSHIRTTMVASNYIYIGLIFLLIALTGPLGGQCRTLRGWHSMLSFYGQETAADILPRRQRRESLETQMEHCAQLAAPWMEATGNFEDNGQLYRFRVLSLEDGSLRRPVFPEQPLFRFVRRVYRCCQLGFHCRGVKGIQGRPNGGSEVEFLLSADVLSVPVLRAEIHLRILNPHHLSVEPWLPSMAKQQSPTRYSMWSNGEVVELRVDILFLFQHLQQAAGGARGGSSLVDLRRVGGLARLRGAGLRGRQDPKALQDTDGDVWGDGGSFLMSAVEFGLVLHCSKGGATVSCKEYGVQPLHTPFIALSYR